MWDEATQRLATLLMAKAQCVAESRMHKAADLAAVIAEYEEAVRAMRRARLEPWEIDVVLDVARQQADPKHYEWVQCHVCRAVLMQRFVHDQAARSGVRKS